MSELAQQAIEQQEQNRPLWQRLAAPAAAAIAITALAELSPTQSSDELPLPAGIGISMEHTAAVLPETTAPYNPTAYIYKYLDGQHYSITKVSTPSTNRNGWITINVSRGGKTYHFHQYAGTIEHDRAFVPKGYHVVRAYKGWDTDAARLLAKRAFTRR